MLLPTRVSQRNQSAFWLSLRQPCPLDPSPNASPKFVIASICFFPQLIFINLPQIYCEDTNLVDPSSYFLAMTPSSPCLLCPQPTIYLQSQYVQQLCLNPAPMTPTFAPASYTATGSSKKTRALDGLSCPYLLSPMPSRRPQPILMSP